jgi:hypothetical protein
MTDTTTDNKRKELDDRLLALVQESHKNPKGCPIHIAKEIRRLQAERDALPKTAPIRSIRMLLPSGEVTDFQYQACRKGWKSHPDVKIGVINPEDLQSVYFMEVNDKGEIVSYLMSSWGDRPDRLFHWRQTRYLCLWPRSRYETEIPPGYRLDYFDDLWVPGVHDKEKAA